MIIVVVYLLDGDVFEEPVCAALFENVPAVVVVVQQLDERLVFDEALLGVGEGIDDLLFEFLNHLSRVFGLHLQVLPDAIDLPVFQSHQLFHEHVLEEAFGYFEVEDRPVDEQLVGQIGATRLVAQQQPKVRVYVYFVLVVLDH